MKSTSESVRSKTSLAHVAMPGEYSSHSTWTLDTVIPSTVVFTTSVMPRAITSRCSAVKLGFTYSANTF